MKRITLFSLLTIIALISAISLPLVAGPFGGKPHAPQPGMMMDRHFRAMAAELKLSGEQQARITSARDAFRLAQIEHRSNMAKQQLAIEQAMRPEAKTSDASMMALFEQQAGLQAKMAMERYRLRMTMQSVLTPEQRQKMESLQAARKEERRERMHQRMGMSRGDQDADRLEEEEDDSPRPPRRPW